jgi:hypothetical protein
VTPDSGTQTTQAISQSARRGGSGRPDLVIAKRIDRHSGFDYVAFMKRYFSDRDPSDVLAFGGYGLTQTMVYILEQCGDNLTRENVMH